MFVFVNGGGPGENRGSQKHLRWKRLGVQYLVQGQTSTDGHIAGFHKNRMQLADVSGSITGYLQFTFDMCFTVPEIGFKNS